MTISNVELEIRAFTALTVEVAEAVKARDDMTARDALSELEGMWMHTESPALRDHIADFMGQHAAHGEFVRFYA